MSCIHRIEYTCVPKRDARDNDTTCKHIIVSFLYPCACLWITFRGTSYVSFAYALCQVRDLSHVWLVCIAKRYHLIPPHVHTVYQSNCLSFYLQKKRIDINMCKRANKYKHIRKSIIDKSCIIYRDVKTRNDRLG